jgi:hypothetical protein
MNDMTKLPPIYYLRDGIYYLSARRQTLTDNRPMISSNRPISHPYPVSPQS